MSKDSTKGNNEEAVRELKNLQQKLNNAQMSFELETLRACEELVKLATQIAPAIGEISIAEAKLVIVREFIKRYIE